MKTRDIVPEEPQPKPKKPGVFQKGGAIDRTIGKDSGFAGLLKRAQQKTGMPGPKAPNQTAKSSSSSAAGKAQKKTGMPGTRAVRSVQQIPDRAAVVNPNNQAVYQYNSDSKQWINQKNPRDKMNTRDGLALYQKSMRESVLVESGSLPGVGAIHISEIEPTLTALEKKLGIDLKNNVLGSVGKNEFSGDIDVALQIDPKDAAEFLDKLKSTAGVSDVTKTSVIMSKVKIENYDNSKETNRPRTGYVQVDFMPGDPGWMKTFYHAPSEKESKYKGVFRNIIISTIAAFYDKKQSEETIDDGRPVEVERWLWSPTEGLVRVKRTPVPNKAGTGYTKKNQNEIIDGPYKTADEIADKLGLDTPQDLNSFETVLAAIEKNYPGDVVDKIKNSFADNSIVKDIGVPDELIKTESLGEKHLRRIKELVDRMP